MNTLSVLSVALAVFVVGAVLLILTSLALVDLVAFCPVSYFLLVVLVCLVLGILYLLLPAFGKLVLAGFRKYRENRWLRQHGPFVVYIIVLLVATFLIYWCGESCSRRG